MWKILESLKAHLVAYPTSLNLNYLWSFGSLSGLFVFFQLITGFILAAQYNSDGLIAFENMEHIMRDVNSGWLLRYLHANSASIFFMCMYIHVFRGIFFKSFVKPRNEVWFSGVLILLVSIIVAFIGYVLPWGQMSFWGATVITNLLTAIPVVGKYVVIGLWGSFSITNITLIRFFDFHYILAIILVVIILLHLTSLHYVGSSTPLAVEIFKGISKFFRNFMLKDAFLFIECLILLCALVFYYPNVLGHSDNYIKANALVTPTHIVPEWYFLPFYAISRSIDDKLLGVIAMVMSILIIGFIGFFKETIKPDLFNIFETNFFFWIFFICIIVLWFVGSLPAEYPYIIFGKIFTFIYFFNFVAYFIFLKIFKNQIINSILGVKNSFINPFFLKFHSVKKDFGATVASILLCYGASLICISAYNFVVCKYFYNVEIIDFKNFYPTYIDWETCLKAASNYEKTPAINTLKLQEFSLKGEVITVDKKVLDTAFFIIKASHVSTELAKTGLIILFAPLYCYYVPFVFVFWFFL